MNGLITGGKAFLAFLRDAVEHHPRRVMAVVGVLTATAGGGALAVASLAPDAADLPVRQIVQDVEPLPLVAQQEALDVHSFNLYRSDTTRSNDTADTLLARLGVSDAQAAAFLRGDANARQTLFGRAGRNVTAEADDSNTLVKLVARWSPDDDGRFKRLVVEKTGSGYASRLESAEMTASMRLASGTIRSSLFAATDEAKLPDSIAIQIAEIFSGDIDFHRALRRGDHFSIVYETLEGDGEPMRVGRVLSAEFVNAGKTFQAMWFGEGSTPDGQQASGKGGYYTMDGQSLRHAFLASPLEFSRVTSGFKMRFHPILQTWRAHLGVDYGAPTGTPVRSVGDGVVDFAGIQNGFGNVVMVKHNNSSTTVYAHLSKINVKKGQAISQGQNLGNVGATGWATGPHLHFEFRQNGHQVDPITVARQSESIPITASAKPAFMRTAAAAKLQLAAAATMVQTTAAQ
jgi:murein DD-endopeptidase MepM/ murein hydrolase activator NlpD